MSTDVDFPKWLMLERFVFRREPSGVHPLTEASDTGNNFLLTAASGATTLDKSYRVTTASGTTTFGGRRFDVAFRLAEPPSVSRLYVGLQEFPEPREEPLAVLTSHSHLVLLRVGIQPPSCHLLQDFFIYDATIANPSFFSPLKRLPTCELPTGPLTRNRRAAQQNVNLAKRCVLAIKAMGLVTRGKEFVVAELSKVTTGSGTLKGYADIRLLHSRTSCDVTQDSLGGTWKSIHLPIIFPGEKSKKNFYFEQISLWQINTVIPSNKHLCWIDYDRGILLCDVFSSPIRQVSFLLFPLEEFPVSQADRRQTCTFLYRGVTAIHDGSALRFINVTRDDGIGYGALKCDAGFTVSCHTLMLGTTVWNEDFKFTSDDLWNENPGFVHDILMYPQVDMDDPNVVHFLRMEFQPSNIWSLKKMHVTSINMCSKKVLSDNVYINGKSDMGTPDFDLTEAKSTMPLPFLPCEFSRFLHSGRKRKPSWPAV